MTPSSDPPDHPARGASTPGGTNGAPADDSSSQPVPLDETVSSAGPPESLTADLPKGPQPGAQLGQYRIIRELGRGGMGVVYEAEDVVLRRRVALKVMNTQTAADEAFRERFLREGRAVAALKSDHVVDVYAAGEQDGVLYLAMEFIDGPTLEGWLLHRTLTPADVVWVARHLLSALAAAHAQLLIHRDVKPGNLMFEPSTGRLKLLDFGLVRDITPVELGQLPTATMGFLGTPSYMSPEQARQHKLDPRSDLFSTGTVLYRLFAGRSPFSRPTTNEALIAVATERPPQLTNAPAPLARFIARLMAENPDNRPNDAGAALDELRGVETELAAQSAPTDPDFLPQPETPEPAKPAALLAHRTTTWAATAGAAVLLGVIAVVLLTRDKNDPESAQNLPRSAPKPPPPTPPDTPRKPLTGAQVLRLVREDIDAHPKAPDPERSRLYLFAPHLASGSNLSAPDRTGYRTALDALAAHLRPDGKLLRPLDPDGTVFAVEPPPEFGAPDGLFVGYPYGLSIDQPDALRREDEYIRKHTGPVAYVRTDWFVRYAVQRLASGARVYGATTPAPRAVSDWATAWGAGQVDLATAADELGADRDQVKLTIRTHEPLMKAFRLGPLADGKTVGRNVWESREFTVSGFQELARELNLGSPVLTR